MSTALAPRDLPELASEINAEHEAAERAINNSLGHAHRCGELLLEAKKKCDHGEWVEWLSQNFRASYRTAAGYMRIAKANVQGLAHLGIEGALKALAEPREREPDLLPAPPRYAPERLDNEATWSPALTDAIKGPQPLFAELPHRVTTPLFAVPANPSGVIPISSRVDSLETLDAEEERELAGVVGETLAANRLAVHHTSDTGEWYTPAHIIDAVTAAIGPIDLDPCSNPGEPSVPAAKHFTYMDDGLTKEWAGTVYMNPPYGRGIGDWTSKLLAAFEAGSVTAAVALVPARTDTVWMNALRNYPRCFVRGRIAFSGHENAAPFPSCAVYFGNAPQQFAAAFADLGDTFSLIGDG